MIEGKPLGVIVVQSYENPDLFSERDLEILNFVSDQVAMAIEHIQSEEAIRESEQKYRKLSAQMDQSNQMKALLLDVITHDIKNPSGVIHGMVDILTC